LVVTTGTAFRVPSAFAPFTTRRPVYLATHAGTKMFSAVA
jgi:hypothetical protein